jgi:hypothetical protein
VRLHQCSSIHPQVFLEVKMQIMVQTPHNVRLCFDHTSFTFGVAWVSIGLD